jgi:hypothetical protein
MPDDPKPKPRNTIALTEQEQALVIKEIARRLETVRESLEPTRPDQHYDHRRRGGRHRIFRGRAL